VRGVPAWFHSLDLGGGLQTAGVKSHSDLASELEALRLPELRAKSVLDIGAWDGFYSFEAERAGASRVVALDHFAWSMDLAAWDRYQLSRGRRAPGRSEQLVVTQRRRIDRDVPRGRIRARGGRQVDSRRGIGRAV